ncbi:MAG: tRNA guanosine(34) transglycosylase Tgt [Patescibacteria group bacterium]|jgi:queuine tRNA-ribosyltransferase|nr:tRNA guanosine(34) transglycosylase Tgt [Patescibacteria group bacterium]
MYKLIKKNGSKRVGEIEIAGKKASTPFFMPIATRGAVKGIEASVVKEMGFEVVLGNTYHLWLRPTERLIKNAGGLHHFMNWGNLILTDSGGFQVFSLGARAKERFGKSSVKLSEEGVSFQDPIDGKTYFMSPEKSIQIQLDLGSNMIMCLDECPPYPCTHKQANKSLELTTRWAARCKEYFTEKIKELSLEERPYLFAIVQGSNYEDLRVKSAEALMEIGFDGYAIGGVAVGEPRENLYEILDWVLPLLPEDKLRYLMGLGNPEEIVAAVEKGIDMFDCVIPTREGRHGRLFVWDKQLEIPNKSKSQNLKKINTENKSDVDNLFYKTLNINNRKFREDFSPVDANCDCELCQKYTKAYLRHLFNVGDPLASRLGALHNLRFYKKLMERLRG